LIAPRHVERAAEVREILKGTAEVAPDQKVLILDKIGYLNGAYSFAALVFIGGSLVAHGGQNPIEPAIVEKPVMFGPHMFNFKDIADSLVRGGGAVQVSDKEEMVIRAKELLSDKTKARAMGKNAKDIVVAGRGATLKNIEIIGRLLQGRGC
jgi:3-deoxy-D-manno-octulosonic-acid transferase